MNTLEEFNKAADASIDRLQEDLKSIRSGRASGALVEDLIVETYGGSTSMRIRELATITTDGPTRILIIPFDPSTLADIERAIQKSNLGLSASVQGTSVQALVPPLSTEQRDKFVRIVGTKTEEARNVIRNYRDDLRRTIKAQKEAKELSEDEKFRIERDIDAQTQTYMDKIANIKEAKTTEIQTV